MALTKSSLSDKIKAAVIALYGPADDTSLLQKFSDAMAKAIVDEIQQNAVVNVTVVGGSSAGAHTGTVT